jgi:stage III sporulation protein AD
MDTVLRTIAGVMLALILGITLSKQGKDMTVVLTVAVCCMVVTVAISFLDPVVDFFSLLRSVGDLDSDIMGIILKCTGISLIAEIAGLICSDSGFGAMGKAIKILAMAAVLWMSLPLMTSLVEMLQSVMGEV